MVLGENQIVSQLKAAYAMASEQGTTGRVLNRLYHHAFAVSKRVRTETGIGMGKVSVPSVAVGVASKIFADFSNKQILVVGAGDMAQLVCQYLRDADANKFIVTSRTLLNAKALAEACEGEAVPFDQLDEQLSHADIVIAATACPQPFLTAERIREAQKKRRGRLLFLIDLAVPRNVDPEAAKLEQVYVYDIDALGKMVAETQQHRATQLEACEHILDAEVEEFERWVVQAKLNPLIQQMYQDAYEVGEAELERLFNRCPDMTPEQKKAVAQTVDRLVGKFMHPCVATIRRHSLAEPSATLAGELRAAKLKIQG
jgi:glutamyl-tRNA reductase